MLETGVPAMASHNYIFLLSFVDAMADNVEGKELERFLILLFPFLRPIHALKARNHKRKNMEIIN